MRGAHTLQHIMQGNLNDKHPLFASLVTGAYVLYAKPFIDSGGVGLLSEKMVPKEILSTHAHTLKVRHQIMAHKDSEPTLFSEDILAPHIRVVRIPGGGFQFEAQMVWPAKPQLAAMLQLCHSVHKNLHNELGRIVANHFHELPTEGECKVNITDPNGPFFIPA